MPHLTSTPADASGVLAANVIALRAKGNWSTRALAEHAQVSRELVLNLEAGRSKLTLSAVDKLAKALGVKTGSLLGSRPVARFEDERLIEAVLATNLVLARSALNLSQRKLSERSGVSAYVIADIERQVRNATLLTLSKLAAPLGLSLEALLTDTIANEGLSNSRG